MSADRRAATTERAILRLRPGAEVLRLAPDTLAVMFANFSVSFHGVPQTRLFEAILGAAGRGVDEAQCAEQVAHALDIDGADVVRAIEQLEQAHCLFRSRGAWGDHPLSAFYGYAEQAPEHALALLRETRPVIVVPSGLAVEAGDALEQAALTGGLIGAEVGEPLEAVLGRLDDAMDEASRPLAACWGFGYRSPLALALNDHAIERGWQILFGATEGALARIGPLVIPHNTGCLVCAQARLLANAGPEEVAIAAAYARRHRNRVAPLWPTHPLFERVVLGLFVLELSSVVTGAAASTIGGFVEIEAASLRMQRRRVLRVPRCPACVARRPARLPWDVRFENPRGAG